MTQKVLLKITGEIDNKSFPRPLEFSLKNKMTKPLTTFILTLWLNHVTDIREA